MNRRQLATLLPQNKNTFTGSTYAVDVAWKINYLYDSSCVFINGEESGKAADQQVVFLF